MADEEDFDDDGADEQPNNKQPRITPLLPYMWKKGQSGNPAGRPKGKTMKDYAREMLECMTDEERQDFMHGLPKEIIWKMAEGNPSNNTDLTTGGHRSNYWNARNQRQWNWSSRPRTKSSLKQLNIG
jgi:hypothetical protein